MKIYKKLILAGGILLAATLLLNIGAKSTFAASSKDNAADIKSCTTGTMVLINAQEIQCKDTKGTIAFIDNNTNDGIENYVPSESDLFCDPGNMPGMSSDTGRYGINLIGSSSGNAEPGDLTGQAGQAVANSHQIQVYVNLGYGDCTRYTIPGTQNNELTIPVAGTFQPLSINQEDPSAAATTTTTASTPTCESNDSAGAFSWLFCPAFDVMDSAAGVFNSFIEGQLCVNTGTSSTAGSECGNSIGDNNSILNGGVKTAWTVFRNLASALLVIVLLIMVISQAIGGGPFDAYTVRKVLPKIVAAVIFMQLSWVLVKYAIDLSNDLGRGVSDLMLAPFGGSSNLTLGNMLGSAFGQLGTVGNGFVLFSAIAAAAVAGIVVSIPTLALVGLYVVLALLTAFLVLVFRKLLIIMLVILAPVAFVLWVLPGTERYWTMWKDNFTKVLLMFPMIEGLVASGKIFAYITSGTSNGSLFSPHLAFAHLGPLPVPVLGSVTNFAEVIIIIAAYFGPYFLLPKTYSWGGAAMSAAAKGVSTGVENLGGKQAKEYLNWRQGLSPWKQARAARRAESERNAHHAFHEGLNSEGLGGSIRRARLGGVGRRGDERALRGRIVENAQTELDKHDKEEIARATVELMRNTLPQYAQGSHDDIREAVLTGKTARVERLNPDGTTTLEDFDGAAHARAHPHSQRAAADRAVIHGQWGAVDQYYTEAMNSGDPERIREATQFKDDNAAAIGDKLTHVLKGYGVAVAGTESDIAKMSGHEIESVIAEFSSRIATGSAPGATREQVVRGREAATQLQGFLARHQQARRNPSLLGSVDLRGTAAVDSYLGALRGDPRARVQIDRINHGTPDPVTGTLFTPDGRRVDREANRERYQTHGLPPNETIPLIHI